MVLIVFTLFVNFSTQTDKYWRFFTTFEDNKFRYKKIRTGVRRLVFWLDWRLLNSGVRTILLLSYHGHSTLACLLRNIKQIRNLKVFNYLLMSKYNHKEERFSWILNLSEANVKIMEMMVLVDLNCNIYDNHKHLIKTNCMIFK